MQGDEVDVRKQILNLQNVQPKCKMISILLLFFYISLILKHEPNNYGWSFKRRNLLNMLLCMLIFNFKFIFNITEWSKLLMFTTSMSGSARENTANCTEEWTEEAGKKWL